jgi:hypothetical protein
VDRLSKGSLDLAKLEPALSRHPSGRNLNHARVFAPVLEPHSGTTSNNLEFMKPTPQISQNRQAGYPLNDYNFQTTDDPKSSCSNFASEKKSPAFHKLSSDYFGAEAYQDYVTNFLVFTVLGLITAWPIFSTIVAVVGMARY